MSYTKTGTGQATDGTDGDAPPLIPGTGIRGWLRSIYDRLASVPVTGTFWQATQPVSGTVAVSSISAITGTVTANAGTNLNTSALALDTTMTGGTAKAVARGGAKGSTAAADLTSNPVDTNTQALHVDGSKVTQPVSGAFWQSTQPVSGSFWQATQPVSGAFYQATQPVSATSLPLPTGAATLAKQPALGTAGSAAADVISVQGVASMTALKVDGSGATQPVSGTFWQATQPVSGTFWQATQPVSGTFYQATQPISAASLPLPSGASTSALQTAISGQLPSALGTKTTANSMAVNIASDQTVPVSGIFYQATQPISAASLPLPSGASMDQSLQVLQFLSYAQLVQQNAALRAQSFVSGQAVFLPELPGFLGAL